MAAHPPPASSAHALAALPPDISSAVHLIWDYLQLNHTIAPAAAILALGSNDVRVAERAADLYLAGLAPLLIFSGGVGALTAGQYGGRSEAAAFADAAAARGVPRAAMLVEGASTNTGENIRFTRALLEARGAPPPASLILVQKPFMERRTLATFLAQWGPPPTPAFAVTSPRVALANYPDARVQRLGLADVIETMCGDLQRIAVYPARGFQVPMPIPADVWAALRLLVRAGFGGPQLIRAPGAPVGSRELEDYEGLAAEAPPEY